MLKCVLEYVLKTSTINIIAKLMFVVILSYWVNKIWLPLIQLKPSSLNLSIYNFLSIRIMFNFVKSIHRSELCFLHFLQLRLSETIDIIKIWDLYYYHLLNGTNPHFPRERFCVPFPSNKIYNFSKNRL